MIYDFGFTKYFIYSTGIANSLTGFFAVVSYGSKFFSYISYSMIYDFTGFTKYLIYSTGIANSFIAVVSYGSKFFSCISYSMIDDFTGFTMRLVQFRLRADSNVSFSYETC
jgi:hypothetical protein